MQFRNTAQVNYGVKFQMMSKIDVNGPNAHPVYQVRNALEVSDDFPPRVI